MNTLSYKEAMKLAEESFYEYLNDEGFDIEQSIAAALEDCIIMVKKNKLIYNAVIVALSLIGLKNKILTDYLYERIIKILEDAPKEIEQLNSKDYERDIDNIRRLLGEQSFEVIIDEVYKLKVDMLLSNIDI